MLVHVLHPGGNEGATAKEGSPACPDCSLRRMTGLQALACWAGAPERTPPSAHAREGQMNCLRCIEWPS